MHLLEELLSEAETVFLSFSKKNIVKLNPENLKKQKNVKRFSVPAKNVKILDEWIKIGKGDYYPISHIKKVVAMGLILVIFY